MTDHEEVQSQMRRDELMDAIKLSPREFAELMGMSPQLVYYHIRRGKIEKETCICGRPVVDVRAAKEAIQAAQEARSGIVAREPDDDNDQGQGSTVS